MAFVEVTASGIISTNAAKPNVRYGRFTHICNDRRPLEPVIQPDEGRHVQQRIEE